VKKQVYLNNGLNNLKRSKMSNKETLEEAAKRIANDSKHYGIKLDYQDGIYYGFKIGVKWQADKMYSEKDLIEAFRKGSDNVDYCEKYGWSSKLTEQEWFEQFKKQKNEQ